MTHNNPNRREFLARSTKAGLAIAATGLASAILYDKKGPTNQPADNLVTIPDFSVPAQPGNTISIVKGPNRTNSLNKAIDLLGGIERFIKPGDKVLIKPNVAFASPPSLGATTHPDLIEQLVQLCYRRGRAKQVYVADNPINDPASCFQLSGIGRAAANANAKVIIARSDHFKPTTLTNGRLIKNWPLFYEPLKNVNKVIGIAPVKDHHRSGASMSMKNWYGLLGGQRNIFHQDINTIITELAMLIKPTFVILDGTNVMISNGPTGGSVADLQTKNTLIASCDQVAADTYAASLLNLTTNDLPYLTKAQNQNAGTTNLDTLKPLIAQTDT